MWMVDRDTRLYEDEPEKKEKQSPSKFYLGAAGE